MSGIPEEWSEISIGDLNRYVGNNINPSNFPNEVFELYSVPIYHTGEPEFLASSDIKSSKQSVRKDDVLVCKINPRINRVWLVRDYRKYRQIASSEWIVIRQNNCNPQYLRYFFSSSGFREKINSDLSGVGGSLTRARPKIVKNYLTPLAPFHEQCVIVSKLEILLGQVDKIKSRIDGIPEILKRFRQSVLSAAVSGKLTEDWRGTEELKEDGLALLSRLAYERNSQKTEIYKINGREKEISSKKGLSPDLTYWNEVPPETWAVCSVSQYAECMDKLRVPVKKEHRNSTRGLFPYYGANGKVDEVDDYIFDDDLVLVTEDETFYGRTKPIAFRVSGKCWVNNHAHVLRAENESSNDYLCYCLMFYNVLPWLSGTTGRAKLTQQALNTLPIMIPPNKEANIIVRRVKSYFSLADSIESKVDEATLRIDTLTKSILFKAFSGDLTKEWRELNRDLITGENSAFALLEKIKIEQAKLKSQKRSKKA